MSEQHEYYMRLAMEQAAHADRLDEVPVGAVLVHEGEVIAAAFNQPIAQHDPCAHAEVQVLREAGKKLGNYRLVDTQLYVTVEPCTMCVGAILHARVGHVIYGTAEPKMGAVDSAFQLLQDDRHYHRIQVTSGILAEECKGQMQAFFKRRRAEKAEKKLNPS